MAAPLQTLVAHPDHVLDEARGWACEIAMCRSSPLPRVLATASLFPTLSSSLQLGETSPEGVIRQHVDKAKSVSVVLLLLGVTFLWVVHLSGALALATAGLGLTVFWEAQPGGPSASPSITPSATITASQPLTSPSTGH